MKTRTLPLAKVSMKVSGNCWRENAISASRDARNLNSPTNAPPGRFKKSIIPAR
jgi:hypothetical protein